jgi:serine/threonine-protein kinase
MGRRRDEERSDSSGGGEPDLPLPIGTAVDGYRIEDVLGAGGFGTVHAAVHEVIGKRAAIKVLHRRHAGRPEAVARFVEEARIVNSLRHPDIVEVFGFGTLPDGRRYHLMDLLEGAPLDRLLAEQTRLPVAPSLAILRGVARALAAAHARGIAHGDLKPANVFVDSRDGTVPKLLDFGLSALRGEPGQPTLAGSPHYMSPEQCRGEPPSVASDVYAFGVLSYRLLAGVLPFDGEDWLDVLVRHTSEEPVPPSRRESSLPAAVDGAILRMLDKRPEGRPADAAAAFAELERAFGPAKPPRRRGARIGAVAVALVAAAGLAFVLQPAGTRAPRAAPRRPARSVVADHAAGVTLAAPAPSARRVRITIRGTPEGTLVRGPGGVVLGAAPGPIDLDRGRTAVRLELAGRLADEHDRARRGGRGDRGRGRDPVRRRCTGPRGRGKLGPARPAASSEPPDGPQSVSELIIGRDLLSVR